MTLEEFKKANPTHPLGRWVKVTRKQGHPATYEPDVECQKNGVDVLELMDFIITWTGGDNDRMRVWIK